jgi:hypothetical protein
MSLTFKDCKTDRRFVVDMHADGTATVTYTPLDGRRPRQSTQMDPVRDDPGAIVAYEIARDEAAMITDRLNMEIDRERFSKLGGSARARLVEVV